MAEKMETNDLRRIGKWHLAVLVLIGWGVLNAPILSADEENSTAGPAEFMRFVKENGSEGHVDTAITTYRRNDGVSVALVAAVHIADGKYYKKLQTRFKDFDAVLYEMVKPKDEQITRDRQSDSGISTLQIGMKNLLELEFQLDAIDYSPDNFVHADMDPETFWRLQEDSGESILGLMIRAVLEEQNRKAGSQNPFEGLQILYALMSKDSAYKLKFILAQQLQDMEAIVSGIDQGKDGQGSVLVSGRNEVAMKVLGEQIQKSKRRLAIFYGAGHMPDLEERLLKAGFKQTKKEWVTAWDIRREKHTDTE